MQLLHLNPRQQRLCSLHDRRIDSTQPGRHDAVVPGELGAELCGCRAVGLQRLVEGDIVIPTSDPQEECVRELQRALSLAVERGLHERDLDRGVGVAQRR